MSRECSSDPAPCLERREYSHAEALAEYGEVAERDDRERNKRLESPLYHLSEMSSGELSRASTGLQNAIEGAALTH